MTVFSKRNIILPGPDGKSYKLRRDCFETLPDGCAQGTYFKALAADGKIVPSQPEAKKPLKAKAEN